jgi:hypothetical protein
MALTFWRLPNQTGRLIARQPMCERATERVLHADRLVDSWTTTVGVQTLFGHPSYIATPDGFVYYYTLDVFNPFEQLSGRR